MDYATVAVRNPAQAWKTARAQKSRKQKKGRGPGTKSKKAAMVQMGRRLVSLLVVVAKTVLLIAFAYGLYEGYGVLTTSPRFAVSRIHLQGNHRLSETEVLNWVGGIAGKNIFLLDLEALTRRLTDHPWVRAAVVERTYPQRVHITLEERIPYARIRLTRTYILDNFGVLLGEAGPAQSRLPLIIGLDRGAVKPGQNVVTGRIIQGLQTMHYFNRLEFFRADPIDTFQILGGHRVQFITRRRAIKIFMDLDMLYESFEKFKILLDTLEEEEIDMQYIDLSFTDKIVIKRGPSIQPRRNT